VRKDLLEDAQGLWDLIADHDQRCAYHTIRRLAEQLSSDTPERADSAQRDHRHGQIR
jgi:DNA-binding MurR/RpiR family transcriptional regulator